MTTSVRNTHSDGTLLVGRPVRSHGHDDETERSMQWPDERFQQPLRTSEQYGPYADRTAEESAWKISAESRAGPPLVGHRRRAIRRLIAAGAIALASGWAFYDWHSFHTVASRAAAKAFELSALVLERPSSLADGSAEAAGGNVPPAPLPEAITEEKPAEMPFQGGDPGEPSPPKKLGNAVAEPSPAASAPPEPLPPTPPVSSLKPYQRRAAAAGLHTQLSRVLLESLTEADYRNAAIAIDKAFTRPSDDAVLIWPPQSSRGLAQFQIHFVRGARGCRRYVVTVAKLGWLTTALPLERCGKAKHNPQRKPPLGGDHMMPRRA